jgi:hypothetical protein
LNEAFHLLSRWFGRELILPDVAFLHSLDPKQPAGLEIAVGRIGAFPRICLKPWQTFETIRISSDTDGKKTGKNLAFAKKMWRLRLL